MKRLARNPMKGRADSLRLKKAWSLIRGGAPPTKTSPVGVPKSRPHPPGQQRIGPHTDRPSGIPHPQTGTMIKPGNRVGKKGY